MNEKENKTTELNEKNLKQVSGGAIGDSFNVGNISWGPFHDALIDCPGCHSHILINNLPTSCPNCQATLFN